MPLDFFSAEKIVEDYRAACHEICTLHRKQPIGAQSRRYFAQVWKANRRDAQDHSGEAQRHALSLLVAAMPQSRSALASGTTLIATRDGGRLLNRRFSEEADGFAKIGAAQHYRRA